MENPLIMHVAHKDVSMTTGTLRLHACYSEHCFVRRACARDSNIKWRLKDTFPCDHNRLSMTHSLLCSLTQCPDR